MHKTPVLLMFAVLAAMFGTGGCGIVKIPASQAIYIDMNSLQMHDGTSTLTCSIQAGEGASNISASMIQFNISGLNFSDADIGVLVLKAANVSKQSNATNLVVLMPTGSNWTERSGSLSIVANLKTVLNLIERKDMSQMEISTNDGQLFDVSKTLKEARGDKVSFLLLAFSDKNYSIKFKSQKSDAGPYLLAMPYPSKETEQEIKRRPTTGR